MLNLNFGTTFSEVKNMQLQQANGGTALAEPGPSGLSVNQQVALSNAAELLSQGHSHKAAVDYLVSNDMPGTVARVLVKLYDKRI